MDFGGNKMPIEKIREGAFGGTYFRDIYSSVNEKWYKKSWKEFDQLKNIDAKYYASDYYDVNVNKYGVKCGTSLRFWENKGWINEIIDGKNVSRFKGKLVKMIKNSGSKYDDYSISPKIRQILFHWGYELTEKEFYKN